MTGETEEKTTPEVLLKVDHLCQYFKMGAGQELRAVDDISFEIRKGEVFGLVGESGCGKTTTGRSIIKLYDVTGGSVYFKGQRICAGIRSYQDAVKAARAEYRAEASAVKKLIKQDKAEGRTEIRAEYAERLAAAEEKFRSVLTEQTANIRAAKQDERNAKKSRIIYKMQMIFQDPIASLDPRMTVRDIIAEGLIIRGEKDKKFIDEQVYKMLDLVGLLPEHAGRYPHEFSGGQRQRIGIARAIILNPELIIADEPISALDVSIQAQVINLLNDLRERLGLTILFIAHDLSVVKYFSDKIGVMYYGKMVELAPADELFDNPLHPYTKSLLSAIPLPDPNFEKGRKRIVYNPIAEHDYSVDKPVMREIKQGHFIYCNEEEFAKYKKQLDEADGK